MSPVLKGNKDHTHYEVYISGYYEQDHLNDNDKQGSGFDDRKVELHMPYVLSDTLTLQNLNHLAIFLWDQHITYLQ